MLLKHHKRTKLNHLNRSKQWQKPFPIKADKYCWSVSRITSFYSKGYAHFHFKWYSYFLENCRCQRPAYCLLTLHLHVTYSFSSDQKVFAQAYIIPVNDGVRCHHQIEVIHTSMCTPFIYCVFCVRTISDPFAMALIFICVPYFNLEIHHVSLLLFPQPM